MKIPCMFFFSSLFFNLFLKILERIWFFFLLARGHNCPNHKKGYNFSLHIFRMLRELSKQVHHVNTDQQRTTPTSWLTDVYTDRKVPQLRFSKMVQGSQTSTAPSKLRWTVHVRDDILSFKNQAVERQPRERRSEWPLHRRAQLCFLREPENKNGLLIYNSHQIRCNPKLIKTCQKHDTHVRLRLYFKMQSAFQRQ